MKKYRYYVMLLAAVLILSLPYAASAASTAIQVKTKPVTLNFDGQSFGLPEGQFAFQYHNRTYVPLRFISYALQKSVKWEASTLTVSVTEPTEEEKHALAERLEEAVAGIDVSRETLSIALTLVSAKLLFDGVQKQLPDGQAIYMYKGTTYVPIRFLAEASGLTISWDGKTGTITGESAAYREENGDGTGEIAPGSDNGSRDGANGGDMTAPKLTYEEITSKAEDKLWALEESCEAKLTSHAKAYLTTTDQAEKEKLLEKGNQELEQCTAEFDSILDDTSKELKDNGYSTDIIQEYRKKFHSLLEAGYSLVQSMA